MDTQSKELTTAADNANPFEAYGAAATARTFPGKLLKFTKGDYLAGTDNEDIPVGTRMVADMNSLMVGWMRWEDSRPGEHVMGLVAEGYKPPLRKELGDLDQSTWDTDDGGRPRDPWQFTNYLVMTGEAHGEIFTFTSSSVGGRNAVGELAKAYGKEMRARPGAMPIVELDVGSYAHSNKSYGRIKFPIFKLVDWSEPTAPTEALPPPPKPKPVTAAAKTKF